MTWTRRIAKVTLVLLVAATGLGLFAPTAAPASCAGPSIQVDGVPAASSTTLPSSQAETPVVRLGAGSAFTVTGAPFVSGCNDTGSCTSYGPGCSHCDAPEPETPLRDVPLTLEWGGRTFPLGTADAAAGTFAIRWRATLPPDVVPGRGLAVLTAGTAPPVAIEIG